MVYTTLCILMSELLPIGSWAKLAAIDLFVVILIKKQPIEADLASRLLGRVCWFVVMFKPGNSQSQQILPTDSWANFAAIDLFVVIFKSANSQ